MKCKEANAEMQNEQKNLEDIQQLFYKQKESVVVYIFNFEKVACLCN